MKPIYTVVATLFVMTQFSACGGGGDSPAAAGDTSSSTSAPAPANSDASTSTDSEGVAISMITGSNQANGTVQGSSTSAKDAANPTDDDHAANLLLSRIAEKGRLLFQNDATTTTPEKTIHINQTANTITVTFDNEVVTFGDGSLTFNGPVTFAKTSSTTFSATASVSGKYTNFKVSPTVRRQSHFQLKLSERLPC